MAKEIEHPERIKNFLDATLKIDWSNKSEAFQLFVDKLCTLFYGEIEYYYRQRKMKRLLSFWFRVLITAGSSLAFLCPLLASLQLWCFPFEKWGYVLFAVAGITFLADRVFLGSSGHMRFVSTQLRLESEVTLFAIKYQKVIANSTFNIDTALDEVFTFANTFYAIILKETDDWSGELKASLNELKQQIKSKTEISS